MLYILWVILYLGLLLYFLHLLYKVIVVVRREMGLFPVIFLVVILGHQCTHMHNIHKNSREIKYQGKEIYYSKKIGLSPINGLMVDWSMDTTGRVIYKRTDLTGTVVGIEWHPTIEDFEKQHYTIVGTLEWNLLGINLWTQHKMFKGGFPKPKVEEGSFTHSIP